MQNTANARGHISITVDLNAACAAEPTEPQLEQEATDTIPNIDDLIYMDTVLTRQISAHKVCIVVQPSVLRSYSFYYYTSDDKEQEWLQQC